MPNGIVEIELVVILPALHNYISIFDYKLREIMARIKIVIALLAFFVSSQCLAQVESSTQSELCKKIKEFTEQVEIGASRGVTLSAEFGTNVFPVKHCKPLHMDSNELALCKWLSMNMSTEFMAQNIYRVMACLTGVKQVPGANVIAVNLIGKFEMFGPFENLDDAIVEFEYNYQGNYLKTSKPYFSLTASRPKSE